MEVNADAIPSKGAGKTPRLHQRTRTRRTRTTSSTSVGVVSSTSTSTQQQQKPSPPTNTKHNNSSLHLLEQIGGRRSPSGAVKRKSGPHNSKDVKSSKVSKVEEKVSKPTKNNSSPPKRSVRYELVSYSSDDEDGNNTSSSSNDEESTTENEEEDIETESELEEDITDPSPRTPTPSAVGGGGGGGSKSASTQGNSRCCTRSRSNSAGVGAGVSSSGSGTTSKTVLVASKKKVTATVGKKPVATNSSGGTTSSTNQSQVSSKNKEEDKSKGKQEKEVPKEPISSRLRQLPSRVAAASQLHIQRIAQAHEANKVKASQQPTYSTNKHFTSTSSSSSNRRGGGQVSSKTVAPANLKKVGLVSTVSSNSNSGRRSPKSAGTSSAKTENKPGKTLVTRSLSATATSSSSASGGGGDSSSSSDVRYRLRSSDVRASSTAAETQVKSSVSGPLSRRGKSSATNASSHSSVSSRGGSGRVATSNTTGSCASSRCGRGAAAAGAASGTEGGHSSSSGKSGEPGMNTSSSSSGSGNQQQQQSSSSSNRRGVDPSATSGNNNSTSAASGQTSASTTTSAGETGGSGSASATSVGSASGGGGGAAAAAASAFSRGLAMLSGEVDTDEGDMGRLQALLESRGLPPHLFGTLAPRMQQLLQRGISASSGNVTKAQSLLQGLQASGDEGLQLQSAIEMCQLLVMGNEDTLAGFPVKQTVPALITLLSMEHNFDIMNHACRALTYMMEALPRSTPVVAEAVPVLLQKLQSIQCMDVAEQSLTALEMLSRRHAKTILQAKGVEACLTFLDFFSIVAQRAALAITANCMQNLHLEEFILVKESLHFMATRLNQQDKKSVESVCLGFSRLVDSLVVDPRRLEEIAEVEFLANMQQLLVVTPPIVSTATFILVLRMLAQLCSRCPTIAVKLLEQNIVGTLSSLLLRSSPVTTGNTAADITDEVELVQRNPQELLEMMNLIAELLPKLPKDGIFVVNSMMSNHPQLTAADAIQWQWKDDRSTWTSYSPFDSRIIEAAHQSGEDEISLSMQGRTYTVDFLGMQQINEDTGTSRTVQRKVSPFFSLKAGAASAAGTEGASGSSPSTTTPEKPSTPEDERAAYLALHPDFALPFLRPLFALLSEANSSSAGPAVRTGCLKTLLRIVHFLPAASLQKSLKPQLVSNNLCSMLGSSDLKIVVGAFQLCHLFMEKLHQDLLIHFRREGVFHQISRISTSDVVSASPIKTDISSLLGCTPPNSHGHPHNNDGLGGLGLASLGLGGLNFLSTKSLPSGGGSTSSAAAAAAGAGTSTSSLVVPPPPRVPSSQNVNQTTAAAAATTASLLGGLGPATESLSINNTSSSSAGHPGSRSLPVPPAAASPGGGDNGNNTSLVNVGASGITDLLGIGATASGVGGPIQIQPTITPNPIVVNSLTFSHRASSGGKGSTPAVFGMPKIGTGGSASGGGGGGLDKCPALEPSSPIQPAASGGELVGGDESQSQASYDPCKRKRVSKRPIPTSTSRRSRHDETSSSSGSSASAAAAAAASGHSSTGVGASGSSGASGSTSTKRTSSKSGFFASLHPSRWTRGSGGASSSSGSNNNNSSSNNNSAAGGGGSSLGHTSSVSALDRSLGHVGSVSVPVGIGGAGGSGFTSRYHTHNLAASYKEQVKAWLKEQSSAFTLKYCRHLSESCGGGDGSSAGRGGGGVGDHDGMEQHPDELVLPKLNEIIQNIRQESKVMEALRDLRVVVMESDISSFEINHSGLIPALLGFLTEEVGYSSGRDCRIRSFIHVLADCPLDTLSGDKLDSNIGAKSDPNPTALSSLISKLNSCLSQLEQFQVKVHEVPSNSATSRTAAPTSALRFFNTHQLKCNLQRHPACNTLRQWKGGPVKIDSLALVQTIERYLIAKGFGRVRESHDSADSEDDNSDDDIDDTLAAAVISQGSGRHKIQFLIGDNVLPYTMTVYQAIRQFGLASHDQLSGELESDLDPSSALISSSTIWSQTHTIYYRPLPEDAAGGSNSGLGGASSSSSSKKRSSKNSSKSSGPKSKKDPLWNEGFVPDPIPPYLPYLMPTLPEAVTVSDPCLSVLNLLRVIHGICRYWRYLYWPLIHEQPLVPHVEFINSKIAAKAQRQLQDPVVIMAGNVPPWLQQIGVICPFLFPFETRQMLFYSITFDRDRALQRLLDSVPELNGSEREDRVAPRLDRRKRTVSRDNILHHAEQLMNDFGSSRPLLEVQYENEVGTGLGPTLEFYAIVSQELQKRELDLWHAESLITTSEVSISNDKLISTSSGFSKQGKEKTFIHSNFGLYPKPLGRSVKAGHLSKVKNKFKFLGKFMAKAVMDSRMIDLPLSKAVYKWILNGEAAMCLADVADVDSTIARSIRQLVSVVSQKKGMERKMSLSPPELTAALDSLTLDGCPIDNLGLDFTLPGHPSIDLKKGGRDIAVTIHNLEEYIKLVYHWMLIGGIQRQMESWKEGFDSVFPSSSLKMFYPEELEMVFCGANQSANENWDVKTLMECCRADHGYTLDSKSIQYLFQIMSQYNSQERRKFLQFVTGSPRLPVGGFRALQPQLTVVRKTVEGTTAECDEYLPSVMTCVNYLKLPDYSTLEVMRKRLRVAVDEGQMSFHLS